MGRWLPAILLFGLTTLCSCAEEPDNAYPGNTQNKALKAWMTQNRPDLLENYQEEGEYYVDVVSLGDLADSAILETESWVWYDITGRDLQGNISVARDSVYALQQGTFTPYTHYVPYYQFYGELASGTFKEGTYLAMRNPLKLGETYAAQKGFPREVELRVGAEVVLYMPATITIGEIIGEPLRIHAKAQSRAELDKEVSRLMDVVGLSARLFNAYPHELDGGRRQRVGIARALSLQPQFIVCDEPVSSLDVSIQAQVLNLLKDLQAEFHLTYLFITHDLSVVKFFSDKIAVMYLGQLVETADSAELFRQPLHPYSQALLSAIPIPSSRQKMQRVKLIGELQSPIDPEPGCRFAKRCLYAREGCTGRDLALRDFGSGHFCACCRAGALEEQTPSK